MQTNYNGYKITTKDESHSALIYKGEELIKCIAGDIAKDGTHNAIDKAKTFIDTKNNTAFAEAFKAYLQAHINLSNLWIDFKGTGEEFTKLYPFSKSFDDLTFDIELWVNDAVSKLQRT